MIPTPWSNPEPGCFCLNIDGAVSLNSGKTTIGGLLRDVAGNFLFGFSKFIGCVNSLNAELWSLYIGLQLAWDYGIDYLEIQTDCKRSPSCYLRQMLILVLFLLCVASVNFGAELGLSTSSGRRDLAIWPLTNLPGLLIVLFSTFLFTRRLLPNLEIYILQMLYSFLCFIPPVHHHHSHLSSAQHHHWHSLMQMDKQIPTS
ncbi:hypothetical protein V6N12_052780 [Hibiscus sabdariffa]|uniref:RNase H type-1 domain-containing protein n=1 Tax=Hibiscus sabdariffa TaxID=183260 RepID=A0ABR2C2L5_9ROSI